MTSSGAERPLISVYIVAHNYGRYLQEAIESVRRQSFTDYEILVFDDGSTDETAEVLMRYESQPRIRLFKQPQMGLIKTANRAIDEARGQAVLRLDADDYLDENALLILWHALSSDPALGLVYPDYYLVNEHGVVLEHIRQERAGNSELPAHGACSLIRRSALLEVNKYDERNSCQDGFDIWLKIRGRYATKHVALPLFYYRMHGQNLTGNEPKILNSRSQIKERYVEEALPGQKRPKVLAIVPTRSGAREAFLNPFTPFAGKPLIDYTLEASRESRLLDRTLVISESADVLDHAGSKGFETLRRSEVLERWSSRIESTVLWALDELAREDYRPDFVMLLYITSPLRRASHIDEAIYSQIIFGTDSVISLTRNPHFLYRHGPQGMTPLQEKRLLRLERTIFYEENGAVQLSSVGAITKTSFLASTVGHILMPRQDSIQIVSHFEFWMAEKVLMERRTGPGLHRR